MRAQVLIALGSEREFVVVVVPWWWQSVADRQRWCFGDGVSSSKKDRRRRWSSGWTKWMGLLVDVGGFSTESTLALMSSRVSLQSYPMLEVLSRGSVCNKANGAKGQRW